MRESPAGLSMLKLYMLCPRKWGYKYVLGWKTADEDQADPLILGSAIHDCIDKYLTLDVDASENIGRTITSAPLRGRFMRMWRAWRAYWDPILPDWEVLEVEKQYDFVLGNGFPMTLRVDRVMRNRKSNHIYIVDTKTTGWSLGGTIDNYMYDPQPIIYHNVGYKLRSEWTSQFRGWLTDCVYARGNGEAQVELSEPVFYAESEVDNYMDNICTLTDDIAYSLELLEDSGGNWGKIFPAYRGSACKAYNKSCGMREPCLTPPRFPCQATGKFIQDDPEFTKIVHNAFKEIKHEKSSTTDGT